MTLKIDRAAYLLWIDEREVRLTRTEWNLFEYLYGKRDGYVATSTLTDAARVRSKSLGYSIRGIRAKMGWDWIDMRKDYGYRFIPQGEVIDVTPEVKNVEESNE